MALTFDKLWAQGFQLKGWSWILPNLDLNFGTPLIWRGSFLVRPETDALSPRSKSLSSRWQPQLISTSSSFVQKTLHPRKWDRSELKYDASVLWINVENFAPPGAAASHRMVLTKAIAATVSADHDSRETDVLIASGKFIVDWQI